MRPISDISRDQANKIRFVLTDIDDTLTSDGKVTPNSYNSLWNLKRAGKVVVPVTGRPAGWCDCIVRQWPVDAVIGENGAFVFYHEADRFHVFTHPSVRTDQRERLDEIAAAVKREIPLSRIAKDQFSRMYDLAIDFNEDPPRLGLDMAERIRDICERYGAKAKISSIHVNTWYGEYDKVSMARLFLEQKHGCDLGGDDRETVLFVGDSPNDEPMFSFFPVSCAVANIRPFLPILNHRPAFVTDKEAGAGFAQVADMLLASD
jgi:1,2-diacylglycerol 3-alpha-glucosyltransferase